MRSSKTGRKTWIVAAAVWHVALSCWNHMLPISSSSIFVNKNSFNMARAQSALTVTASYLFSKKNGPIMPLDPNLHQRVTRFACVGSSMYACGFSVPQLRQFCLFIYPPRSKWASSENMMLLPKSASCVSRSQAHLAKRIHNHIRSAEV